MSIRKGTTIIAGNTTIATLNNLGIVKPDGNTISINDEGIISGVPVNLDDLTIKRNNEGIIEVIGIKNANNGATISLWVGTLAEYNLITNKSDTTIYYITDDDSNNLINFVTEKPETGVEDVLYILTTDNTIWYYKEQWIQLTSSNASINQLQSDVNSIKSQLGTLSTELDDLNGEVI